LNEAADETLDVESRRFLMPRVLVVDDQRNMRTTLALMLRGAGFEVEEAADGLQGAELGAKGAFDVVLTDLRMGSQDGIGVLRAVKDAEANAEVIVMTAYGTIESAVEAMRLGAFDYIQKPFTEEELLVKVQRAVEKRRLSGHVQLLTHEFKERYKFENIVGRSQAIRDVLGRIVKVAPTDATVLIQGESGTGKELVAKAIHANSRRADAPYVPVNCAAISETLLESELFGHVRGAFTGADRDRIGAFAAADGGTLFLDEIGELPLKLQPKLLRMLELGEVKQVGGSKPQRFDVRVIAATHRDLGEEVNRGTFRGDVYFRLAVVEVHLPPLRDRPDDLAELARAFLSREGAPIDGVEGPNLERLRCYGWPGNVRELRNVLARAVALSSPGTRFADLPILLGATAASPPGPTVTADRPFLDAKVELVEGFERAYLRDLLARHGDNLAHAARVAGVERKHLYRLLDKHGLRKIADPEGE
jgi:two-component system response regulator HydG